MSYILQVIEGYELACKKALDILPECVCSSAKNLQDLDEATSMIRTAVMSKQYGNEDFLANLIAQACGGCCSKPSGNRFFLCWVFLRLHIDYIFFLCGVYTLHVILKKIEFNLHCSSKALFLFHGDFLSVRVNYFVEVLNY